MTYAVSQNFFRNAKLLHRLVLEFDIKPTDLVIDIGAGKGKITREISLYTKRIIAFEPDKKLFPELQENIENTTSIELLPYEFSQQYLPNERYRVFANIPFNSTATIMKTLLTDRNFTDAILFIQLEAAEKFAGEQIGALQTVFSAVYAPQFLFEVVKKFKKEDFTPFPKVKVIALRITRVPQVTFDPKRADLIAYIFTHATPKLRSLHKLLSPEEWGLLHISAQKIPSELKNSEIDKLYDALTEVKRLGITKNAFPIMLNQQASLQKINRTRTAKHWKSTPHSV